MSVTITKPVRRRPSFHPLAVSAVDRLTDTAVMVTFRVPPSLRPDFAFTAGQHLTVRRIEDGADVRRSYSICSTPRDLRSGVIQIGVKAVTGGVFSSFATSVLTPGETVEVMPPLGHFTTTFDPNRQRAYAAVAAGSGITPILSLVGTALEVEPTSTFTLVYGNRYARSVMFAEQLADVKDRYPSRFHLMHVLSREPQDADLLSGRITEERFAKLLDVGLVGVDADEWFLCGPYGMVIDVQRVLAGRGVPEFSVHTELFHVDDAESRKPEPAADLGPAQGNSAVTIILDGRASSFDMPRDERILDAALKIRPELPYACKGGVCSTCKAKLVDGRVEMARNYALEPDELAAGFVLTCQATPMTDTVTVDYDA